MTRTFLVSSSAMEGKLSTVRDTTSDGGGGLMLDLTPVFSVMLWGGQSGPEWTTEDDALFDQVI